MTIAPHRTVTVSALVNRNIWSAVRSQAKAERKSITDLVRPLVIAAMESGCLPEASDSEVANGMVVAIRLPVEQRAALGALAERQGSKVSRAMAAIIVRSFGIEGRGCGG